jgi:N-acyl-D-amino-acid deacylase
VSFGIDYIAQCFSTTREMVEACAPMSPHGLYVTHVRYKKGTLEGVREAVDIGRRANVPVHISHLKGTTPEQIDELLSYIDNTARNEVSFSFDVYPYLPGSTMLNFLLPYDVWEDGPLQVLPKLRDRRVRREFARGLVASKTNLEDVHIAWLPGRENTRHIGKLLSEYVTEVGKAPEDALCDLLIEENLAVLLVFHHGDDGLIGDFLAHECYLMGTDGIYFPDGRVHPRMYGSAPRVLGPCVRDAGLFSLEVAVAKLSDRPARRFGCAERGQVREGWSADLVVFDEETVADTATYADPHQLPIGIDHVVVNGTPVIAGGVAVDDLTDPLPGRSLTFQP